MPTGEAAEPNDGWSPLPGVDGPAERIEYESLDFLDELGHPIRSRIMRQLKQPQTIAEVAAKLDVPVTRLYHHMNRLEKVGLIRVVATRKVAAVTERRYQVAAFVMGVAPKFFVSHKPHEVAAAMGSIFDIAKLGLQREIETGELSFSLDDDRTVLSFGHLSLTPDRHTELISRLEGLLEEFTSDAASTDPETAKIALFVAAHPESD